LLHQHHKAQILEKYQNPAAAQQENNKLFNNIKNTYICLTRPRLTFIKISSIYKHGYKDFGKAKHKIKGIYFVSPLILKG